MPEHAQPNEAPKPRKRGRRAFMVNPTTTTICIERDLLEWVSAQAVGGRPRRSVSQYFTDLADGVRRRKTKAKNATASAE